jgi:hypothetical protein
MPSPEVLPDMVDTHVSPRSVGDPEGVFTR